MYCSRPGSHSSAILSRLGPAVPTNGYGTYARMIVSQLPISIFCTNQSSTEFYSTSPFSCFQPPQFNDFRLVFGPTPPRIDCCTADSKRRGRGSTSFVQHGWTALLRPLRMGWKGSSCRASGGRKKQMLASRIPRN